MSGSVRVWILIWVRFECVVVNSEYACLGDGVEAKYLDYFFGEYSVIIVINLDSLLARSGSYIRRLAWSYFWPNE